MDAVAINAKIWTGRGKAARVLGLDYSVYRPIAAATPFPAATTIIKAAFNSGDNTYKRPNGYNDAVWYGDLDGNFTANGDYLVGAAKTYFIAEQQPLLPIICIECNRSIQITRQSDQPGIGALSYGGKMPLTESHTGTIDTILGSQASWPCSIRFAGRRESAKANLPGDVDQAGFEILLPKSVPSILEAGDIATDDLGRRYSVHGAELSALGYRLIANEIHS